MRTKMMLVATVAAFSVCAPGATSGALQDDEEAKQRINRAPVVEKQGDSVELAKQRINRPIRTI
jgi:hypothetical protein